MDGNPIGTQKSVNCPMEKLDECIGDDALIDAPLKIAGLKGV